MRRALGVEEAERVGVADRVPQRVGDLGEEHVQLRLAQLVVDVLRVVELDHQDRERPVVAHRAVRLLADEGLDELLVPDPGDGVDDTEQRARAAVRLAVPAGVAVLGADGNVRTAVPAGHRRILAAEIRIRTV